MDRFFDGKKIILTGNPVRSNLIATVEKSEAAKFWKLDPAKKTILVIGGSLGARSVNNGILHGIKELPEGCQMIWQTGKYYFEEMRAGLPLELKDRVVVTDFISRMDMAFSMADVVVSRAGAGTISELAILGKPTIFVPSPNVSEDHQTKNAMALVEKNAAMLVKDSQVNGIIAEASQLALDEHLIKTLSKNITKLAKPDAARDIANQVIELAKSKK